MRNVEVYINSEAIKSTSNEAIGVKLVDTDSSWSTIFGLKPNMPIGLLGDNEQVKISFRMSKDTSSVKKLKIGIAGYEAIEFDNYDGTVYYNASFHQRYVSHTVSDEGDFLYFEFNFQMHSSFSTDAFRTDFRTAYGTQEVTIKDYVVTYGASYENTLSLQLTTDLNITFSSSGYAEDVYEYTVNTEDWTRLDLFDYETIDITNSIQDVREIGKVFTDFSKEFDVPASNNNNKVFKHYYNPDVQGFDARFKLDALIKIDGVDYRKGKISLLGANLHNDMAKSYQIVFYGETVALSDILGDYTLRDLTGTSVSNYDFEYTKDSIRDGLSSGYIYNGIELSTVSDNTYDLCFPFISAKSFYFYDSSSGTNPKDNVDSRNIYDLDTTTKPRGIHYDDLKPALRVDRVIKGIEERYNINFSSDFFNSSNKPYYDLFLWLQRESGTLSEQIGVESFELKLSELSYDVSSVGNDWRVDEFGFSDKRFAKSGFNSGISTLTQYDLAELSFDLDLGSNVTHTVEIYADIWDKHNGDTQWTEIVKGEKLLSLQKTGSLTNWNYILNDYVTQNIGREVLYDITIKVIVPSTITNVNVENFSIERNSGAGSSFYKADYDDVLKGVTADYTTIVDYMPNIKVIDFLTGLFKMFNLTAYYDGSEIVIRTLDDYYQNGVQYDLTTYVDTSNTEVQRNNLYSQIDMMFAKDSTFAAQNANELRSTDKNFGNEKLNNVNSNIDGNPNLAFDGGKYEVKVPFEKVMYERMTDQDTKALTDFQWGWFCSKDENPVLGKPLLFYPIKETANVKFDNNVYSDGWGSWTSTNLDDLTTYIRPSNSTDDYAYSLNFGSESDEYTLDENPNSLFTKFWYNYISNIYDRDSRIFTLSAFLPTHILVNLKLNDIVVIGNRKYRINKLEVNLNNGKAKLELFNDLGYYD